ncbi:MAG: hypothetical protein SGPRY_006111, partial [Prymnesium sp.]
MAEAAVDEILRWVQAAVSGEPGLLGGEVYGFRLGRPDAAPIERQIGTGEPSFTLQTSAEFFIEMVAGKAEAASAVQNGELRVLDRLGGPVDENGMLSLALCFARLVRAAEDLRQTSKGMRWEANSSGVSLQGLAVIKSGVWGYGVALGAPVISSGVHRLMYTILRSSSNDGQGMCIGVASASACLEPVTCSMPLASLLGRAVASKESSPECWGVEPSSGRLWSSNSVHTWGLRGKRLTPEGKDLSCAAEGARISIHVDMQRQALGFQVNDLPVVDAGVQLPGPVRPWVLIGWLGDQ